MDTFAHSLGQAVHVVRVMIQELRKECTADVSNSQKLVVDCGQLGNNFFSMLTMRSGSEQVTDPSRKVFVQVSFQNLDIVFEQFRSFI